VLLVSAVGWMTGRASSCKETLAMCLLSVCYGTSEGKRVRWNQINLEVIAK